MIAFLATGGLASGTPCWCSLRTCTAFGDALSRPKLGVSCLSLTAGQSRWLSGSSAIIDAEHSAVSVESYYLTKKISTEQQL